MASKRYYECHITMSGKPDIAKKITELSGWKFSKIDGDTTLGEGLKCYTTKQYNVKYALEFITDIVEEVALELQRFGNLKILRSKVELVVHDHIWK